jgi:tRNA(Ile)-lysidine synthase
VGQFQGSVQRVFRVIEGDCDEEQVVGRDWVKDLDRREHRILESLTAYGLDGNDLVGRCRFPDPQRGMTLHLAVSGGCDSLALVVLALLCGHRPIAHHVDHGMRVGSEQEADLVESELEKLSVSLCRHRVEVKSGPNLEERARDARFGELPEGVATGHTVDDQAETVLINLLRGTSSSGIAAMKPGFSHPILGIRRRETTMICRALDLVPLEDPSNLDPTILRNRVRHEVLPLLSDIARREVNPLLARTASQVRDDVELMDFLIGERTLSTLKEFQGMNELLARRLLRKKIHSVSGLYLSSFHTQRALEVGLSQARSTSLPKGHTLTMQKDGLVLRNADGEVLWCCR